MAAATGLPLAEVIPEFGPLLAETAQTPERPRMSEVQVGAAHRRRTLLVRIAAEMTIPASSPAAHPGQAHVPTDTW